MKKALIFGILGLSLFAAESKAYDSYEAVKVFQEVMEKKVGSDLAYRKVQMHRGGDVQLLTFLATGKGCSVDVLNGRPLVVSQLAVKRNGDQVFVKTWCADRDQVMGNEDSIKEILVMEDEQCGISRYDMPRMRR